MTRATVVRQGPDGPLYKPTRREVLSRFEGSMVLEAYDTYAVLRPKRAKRGGPAEVTLSWGRLYDRAMEDRVIEQRRDRMRARRAKKLERQRAQKGRKA